MYLELKHLRAVRAIHEAGGLARAAERLNLTQSALSHQIKALEEMAGVELFLRRAKPMRLSPSGQKLLRLAERVLPEVRRLRTICAVTRPGGRGGCISPSNATPVSTGCCRCWIFFARHGPISMWISAPG